MNKLEVRVLEENDAIGYNNNNFFYYEREEEDDNDDEASKMTIS